MYIPIPKVINYFAIAGLFMILVSCAHLKSTGTHREIHYIVSRANADFYLDPRIWYQDVHAKIIADKVVLKGEAFFTGPVRGIAKKLKQAGYELEIIDEVNYLPESFANDLNYGIITVPYSMSRYEPVDTKQEGTELLYGEPVRLIRDADPYFQVQSAVGYLGYIPKTALRTVDLEEWNRYQAGKQAVFTRNIILDQGLELKMGTRLPYLENEHLLMADGSEISLPGDQYKIVDPVANPLRQAIIESAKGYLGLPYVWGGRSADGLDCSGFVMQSYAINNLYLPRDTDEMSTVGRIIGLPGWTEAMLPGDLMFFQGSRRMVTHVAIYLGEDKFIHSLGRGVQISSMNPEDSEFASSTTKRFIFAKRLFE